MFLFLLLGIQGKQTLCLLPKLFKQSQKHEIQRNKKGEILMVLDSKSGSLISKARLNKKANEFPILNNRFLSATLAQKTYAKQEQKDFEQEMEDEKNFLKEKI